MSCEFAKAFEALSGGWQEVRKLKQELRPCFAAALVPLPVDFMVQAGCNVLQGWGEISNEVRPGTMK